MNYEESVRALLALGRELAAPQQARVQKFGLENISILAADLGNPQRAVPCAHIAGTNGKGSTAAMLESILRAAGLRTGLYTSPHLERINERIRLNGEDISDEEFAAAWTRVHASIESLMASGKLTAHPTYFECVTAMAFLVFAEQRVDFAIYEVGLGGRLDATNIVDARSRRHHAHRFRPREFPRPFDRRNRRGKSRHHQAGRTVVSSVERPEARAVIARQVCGGRMRASSKWTKSGALDETPPVDGCYSAVATSTHRANSACELSIAPPLPGRFQIRNALAAATAARLLAERGFPITDEAIERGIATVQWPGRLERLSETARRLSRRHAQSRRRARIAEILEREFRRPPNFSGLRRDAR